MTTPQSGDPKVQPIRATYYPVPSRRAPMARRMSLVERIRRAAFSTHKESK